jgi:hypothetical protein
MSEEPPTVSLAFRTLNPPVCACSSDECNSGEITTRRRKSTRWKTRMFLDVSEFNRVNSPSNRLPLGAATRLYSGRSLVSTINGCYFKKSRKRVREPASGTKICRATGVSGGPSGSDAAAGFGRVAPGVVVGVRSFRPTSCNRQRCGVCSDTSSCFAGSETPRPSPSRGSDHATS